MKELTKEREQMQKLLNDAILKERDNAMKQYPAYASAHEAFAVLLEELSEVKAAIKTVEKDIDKFWAAARHHDNSEILMTLAMVRTSAAHAAAEAVQVTAVVLKAEENLAIEYPAPEPEPVQERIEAAK